MEIIEKKYVDKLVAANPSQKEKIQKQMEEEFLQWKNHKPPANALW